MKKHAIWLIILVLLMTSAVALASNEPAVQNGSIGSVSNTLPQLNEGGDCTIGTWTTVSSLTTARSRPSTVYFPPNGNFYVLGGEATGGNRDIPIEEYNPGTATWTDRTNLLTGVSNIGAGTVGNYIYVPGGSAAAGVQSTMQRFDPVANSVTYMAAMPGPVTAHAVAVSGTDVHVLGGSSTGATGTTHYIYDTVGDSWSSGAAVPFSTNYSAATADDTYIYIMGGTSTNLADFHRYDPGTNSWTPLTSLTTGRGGPGAFFDGQNIWAISGGWSTYLTTTEYWDGATWTAGPPASVGVRTIGAAFGNDLGLKAGGWNGSYSAAAEVISITCGDGVAEIDISKSPASQDVFINGDATFTITVTNTGDILLDNVTVTDTLVPDCDASLGSLTPGSASSYTCIDTGVTASYTNVANVTSTCCKGQGPSDSATAQVNVVDGGIEISKAPDYQSFLSGGTAGFTITVTNTGQVSLGNVTVTDVLSPDCDALVGSLGVGESSTYTCMELDVTSSFTNTAVVTGMVDANLPPLMDQDDAFVEINNPTSVSLTGLGGDSGAYTPIWVMAILGVVVSLGLFLRRRISD